MSQSSKCDASCRGFFCSCPDHMEDACFNPRVLSFVINSYLEKLIMHQLSSLHAFLSFTFFSGGFFLYFFKHANISIY